MYNIVRINRFYRIKPYFSAISESKNIHNVDLSDIPKIAVADIRKLLRQKGFAVQDGFTSLSTKCMLCSAEKLDSKKAENRLFVNKKTGKCLPISLLYNFIMYYRIIKNVLSFSLQVTFYAQNVIHMGTGTYLKG